MATISIYINYRASTTDLNEWENGLKTSFFRHTLYFHYPKSVQDLRDFLQADIKKGVNYVFSIGGDGTVNLVAQQLAGTSIKLFVIPGGTANDLAHELGIKANIKTIVEIYQRKSTTEIDLIRINDKIMMTNGGIGLGQAVADTVNRLRKQIPGFRFLMKIIGKRVYQLILVKEPLNPFLRYYDLELESPDLPEQKKKIKTAMVFVNNQPVLGGSYVIAPGTVNSDGHFNVTILSHKSKWRMIHAIIQVKRGKIPYSDPSFLAFETKFLKMTHLKKGPLAFFGDGEHLTDSDVLTISVHPQKMNLFYYNDGASGDHAHDLAEIAVI